MSNDRSDRVYKDMKIFVEGDDGKKRPLTIGYCYEDGDKLRFQITARPPEGARTNWSGLIEAREERGQQANANRDAPPPRGGNDRPAFGGGGRQGFGGRDNGGYRNDIE